MSGGLDKVEEVGRTILVVDDDVAVRVLLRTVLERMNFTVELAEDGAAALQKLERSRYSLLLLDLMMPRMNGFDVIATLRPLAGEAHPHIIVFTGADQTGIDQIPPESVCATIRKPFDLPTFLATVRECIGQEHPAPVSHEA